MEIKAVLFDKDGTIIDFGETFDAATSLVLDEICRGDPELMNKAAEAIRYDLKAKKVGRESVLVAGTGRDAAEALSSVIPISDFGEFGAMLDQLYGEICLNTVSPIKGVDKALDDLHEQGLLLGLVTNDSEQNAVDQMEVVELDHLFETITGADSGYGAKPGTGMLDAFVAANTLQPYQVMMVGDSLHDLEAGVAAGMVTVGVESGLATRTELEEQADFIIPSVVDLPALIAKN